MIEVKNLTKCYGNITAVNDISFTVSEGEILGFLGPNGAGKSTTMNIITGYISATEGECIIGNKNILEMPEAAKKHIGYLPENPPLYGDLTVGEYLNFVADLKKVKKAERRKMITELMKSVKITDMEKRLTKNLSKGYRQRVGLAQAMMGNPDVLILDEPTIGLDPKQINEMRDLIRSLGKKHTVILSTHILSEVSAMCDRVMIINGGRIVASDTTENLSRRVTGAGRLQLRIKGDRTKIISALSGISGLTVGSEVCKEQDTLDFIVEAAEGVDIREAVFNALTGANLPLLMMKPLDRSLEEIFLQVTGA